MYRAFRLANLTSITVAEVSSTAASVTGAYFYSNRSWNDQVRAHGLVLRLPVCCC